ncbi:MAG: hypothetical protein V4494_04585 [Chlamydiota bacterium]
MTDLISITVSDVIHVFKCNQRRIITCSLFFAFLVFLAILFSPPKYFAEATFYQASLKNNDAQGLRGLFKNLQLDHEQTEAIPLMFSRRLLTEVTRELGLQLCIENTFLETILSRASRNFLREFGITPREKEQFLFQDVHYDEELPNNFFLVFSSQKDFTVLNHQGTPLSTSTIDKKTQCPQFSFVLKHTPQNLLIEKKYPLKIVPKQEIIRHILTSLEIRPSKLSSHFLTLAFKHESRRTSTNFLNELMSSYQRYLAKENEETVQNQMSFLKKRQESLNAEFKHHLRDYAHHLTLNLKKHGIMGLSNQIEQLAVPIENEYLTKLSAIALEKKHYEKKENSSFSHLQLASTQNTFLHPSHMISKDSIQELYTKYTQELDALEVRLKKLSHLTHQIEDPLFEVTSLSSILSDPISQELIRKASDLALTLRDETNRSEKEQERASAMLKNQKRFLNHHLNEIINLENLHSKLLKEKISDLRSFTLDLLKSEESELLDQLHTFREQIANFPDRWLLENEFKFKKKTSMNVMNALTQLTESKLIQQLLFQVESKPLDEAYSPIKPKHPHLFLFTCAAGIIALFFLTSYYLIRRI